jgi:GntR family transcriptional regulator/MocR family aminotransferase
MADQLGLTRNTVVAAYEELEAQGLVEKRVGVGTIVCGQTRLAGLGPEPEGHQLSVNPAFDLVSRFTPLSHVEEGIHDLRDGQPDPRLLPAVELGRAYQYALVKHQRELLRSGEPAGHMRLRKALAAWLGARRALLVGADQILITRGTRHSMDLLCQALLHPGESAALEDPGNPSVLEGMRRAGAKVVPIPVDEDGLAVEALESVFRDASPRLLYCTPSSQFPTGGSLSQARRARLLELARKHRMAVVEDDLGFEFHGGRHPALPLASQDRNGVVVYIGSFSNLMAPGLRLGFLVAPAPVVARLARLRLRAEAQGDRVLESALASLLEDDTFARFIRKARKAYSERRDFASEWIQRWPGFSVGPCAGLGLWLTCPETLDLDRWLSDLQRDGVLLHGSSHYSSSGSPGHHVRLGFGSQNLPELEAALRLMEGWLPHGSAPVQP